MLAEITQGDDEAVQTFALKLQKLVKLAHPDFTQDQRKSMLLTYFTSKLHPSLRQWVQAFECQTYDDALSKASCLEANRMIDSGSYPQAKIAAVKSSDRYGEMPYQDTGFQKQSEVETAERLDRIESILERLVTDDSHRVNNYGNNRYSGSFREREIDDQQRNSACHYCGKQGHWKNECRLRLSRHSNNGYNSDNECSDDETQYRSPRINTITHRVEQIESQQSEKLQELVAEINSSSFHYTVVLPNYGVQLKMAKMRYFY